MGTLEQLIKHGKGENKSKTKIRILHMYVTTASRTSFTSSSDEMDDPLLRSISSSSFFSTTGEGSLQPSLMAAATASWDSFCTALPFTCKNKFSSTKQTKPGQTFCINNKLCDSSRIANFPPFFSMHTSSRKLSLEANKRSGELCVFEVDRETILLCDV